MYDCSYECTKAEIVEDLGTYNDHRILLCNLWFQDEHGHALATVKNVVVVATDKTADVEADAENLFEDSGGFMPFDEAVFLRFQKLCHDIGYTVYNDGELATMLAQLSPKHKSTGV